MKQVGNSAIESVIDEPKVTSLTFWIYFSFKAKILSFYLFFSAYSASSFILQIAEVVNYFSLIGLSATKLLELGRGRFIELKSIGPALYS